MLLIYRLKIAGLTNDYKTEGARHPVLFTSVPSIQTKHLKF